MNNQKSKTNSHYEKLKSAKLKSVAAALSLVMAVAGGALAFAGCEPEAEEFLAPSAPTSISITNNTLHWSGVSNEQNAEGYVVSKEFTSSTSSSENLNQDIDVAKNTAAFTQKQLDLINYLNNGFGEYEFFVSTKYVENGVSKSSARSTSSASIEQEAPVEITVPTPTNVQLLNATNPNEGSLSWAGSQEAEGYVVHVKFLPKGSSDYQNNRVDTFLETSSSLKELCPKVAGQNKIKEGTYNFEVAAWKLINGERKYSEKAPLAETLTVAYKTYEEIESEKFNAFHASALESVQAALTTIRFGTLTDIVAIYGNENEIRVIANSRINNINSFEIYLDIGEPFSFADLDKAKTQIEKFKTAKSWDIKLNSSNSFGKTELPLLEQIEARGGLTGLVKQASDRGDELEILGTSHSQISMSVSGNTIQTYYYVYNKTRNEIYTQLYDLRTTNTRLNKIPLIFDAFLDPNNTTFTITQTSEGTLPSSAGIYRTLCEKHLEPSVQLTNAHSNNSAAEEFTR